MGLWAFGQDGLSQDRIGLVQRTAAGHDLGILVVTMLVVLLIVGLAVNFSLAERAPGATIRRGTGIAALVGLALVPVLVAGVLATSANGLTGSISKGFDNLTNPNATVPANDPTRLTAIGSVRARYWDEALRIWRAHEAVGVGAGGYRTARLRIRQDTLTVRHAHGYIVQTMADLGLVGLAITLALFGAWLVAAARTTALFPGRARRTPFTPERIGMLSLVAIVVVFGVHSFVDWTWIVPGNAVPAMLCAGWVAGRGSLLDPLGPRPDRHTWARVLRAEPWRVAGALGLVVVTAAAVWTTWQPQRSVNATDDALEAVEANRLPEARADVQRARAADPLSTTPFYVGATVEQVAGNIPGARRLYADAVHMQPVELGDLAATGAVRARPGQPAGRAARDRTGALPRLAVPDRAADLLRREPRRDAASRRRREGARGRAEEAPRQAQPVGQRAIACSERRRSGGPPAGRTSTSAKPGVGEQRAQRARREEAQVVGAGVEVLLERVPAQRERGQRDAAVVRRRHEQAAAPAQHAADVGEKPDDIRDVLEHLAGPHDVERVLVERQRRPLVDAARIEAGHARAGAAQRLLGDVDRDDIAAGRDELRGEGPVAGAEVQDALSPLHVREQERAAGREPLRPRVLRHRPPHRLAPGLHRGLRCHTAPLTTLRGA